MSKKSGPGSPDYEVGYGKPPKEHRFKSKQSVAGVTAAERKRGKRKSGEPQAVNVYALLTEPVQVRKGGQVQTLDPFEVILHTQLELALKERSAAAMKKLIDYAIEHGLIQKSPKIVEGGVLMIPIVTKEDIAFVDSLRERLDSVRGRRRR